MSALRQYSFVFGGHALVPITADDSAELVSRLRRLTAWHVQEALGSCSAEAAFVSMYFEPVDYEDGASSNTHLPSLQY